MTQDTLPAVLGPDVVGFKFEGTRRVVSENDVRLFAELTGDRHPQHLDEQWSESSPFGQRIAHGLLVISFAMGLVPFDPRRVVALRRCDAVFKQPVKFGDGIRIHGQLSAIKPIDAFYVLARWRWRIVNDNTILVARLGIDVLWRNLDVADGDPLGPHVPGIVSL